MDKGNRNPDIVKWKDRTHTLAYLIRDESLLSVEELAVMLDVNATTISHWSARGKLLRELSRAKDLMK